MELSRVIFSGVLDFRLIRPPICPLESVARGRIRGVVCDYLSMPCGIVCGWCVSTQLTFGSSLDDRRLPLSVFYYGTVSFTIFLRDTRLVDASYLLSLI